MNPRPLKAKRMWGVLNHRGVLTEVHPTKGQAELAQNSFIDVTTVRPVLVTYPTPKRKRKAKGA